MTDYYSEERAARLKQAAQGVGAEQIACTHCLCKNIIGDTSRILNEESFSSTEPEEGYYAIAGTCCNCGVKRVHYFNSVVLGIAAQKERINRYADKLFRL